MRVRERAVCTLESAKSARKLLVEKLARMTVSNAGAAPLNLNSQEHWADVGRYKLLEEILFSEDK